MAHYLRPSTLSALLQARAQHPQAQLIAGATDAGLWITQGLRRLPQIIDLTRVAELRRVEHLPAAHRHWRGGEFARRV